jgi:hypothetical protein
MVVKYHWVDVQIINYSITDAVNLYASFVIILRYLCLELQSDFIYVFDGI